MNTNILFSTFNYTKNRDLYQHLHQQSGILLYLTMVSACKASGSSFFLFKQWVFSRAAKSCMIPHLQIR